MDITKFREHIRRVFVTHGKLTPNSALLEVVWEDVRQLPDEFMAWAAQELRDRERLPANLGLHLKKELWPEWRRLFLDKVSGHQLGCADCGGRHDMRGQGFYGFRRNEFSGWDTAFFPCACCPLPRDGKARLSTKAGAARKGWSFMPEDWEGGLTQWEYRLRRGAEYRLIGSRPAGVNQETSEESHVR